jgi:predicted ATPase
VDLLERSTLLDTLVEYAEDARRRDNRLVLVAGEAGIGKTALVDAFRERLPDRRWLDEACDGTFTPLPLGPLFDVAAQVGGDLAAACRDNAPRERLFRALLDDLTAFEGLTVLVVEDLHWADEATLDMLRFLARRLRQTRTLVVVTYRDDELRQDHPLRTTLGALATTRSVRRVNLSPLSPDGVRYLARDSGIEPGLLYRLTSGNPFLVTEVLSSGAEEVPPVSSRSGTRARRSAVRSRAPRARSGGCDRHAGRGRRPARRVR